MTPSEIRLSKQFRQTHVSHTLSSPVAIKEMPQLLQFSIEVINDSIANRIKR